MLYYRETLSAGLLNSLKKQEVCVINVRRDINVAHLSVREAIARSVKHSRLASQPALHGKFVTMICRRFHNSAVGQPLSEDGI
jgi:hypothetical protein